MREMGSVARQRRTETRASSRAMQPGPSASPGEENEFYTSMCHFVFKHLYFKYLWKISAKSKMGVLIKFVYVMDKQSSRLAVDRVSPDLSC